MRLALELGRRGLGNTWPNPAVGTVIVKDGVIVGRGWTQPGGRPHAETQALKRAGEAAQGATLYTSLEPCSHTGKTRPCADAIVRAGVARVVSALEDPNPEVAGQGHKKLTDSGIRVDLGLVGGGGAARSRRTLAAHHGRAARTSCSSWRSHPTARPGSAAAGRSSSPAKSRPNMCSACAPRPTPFWSASARCLPTIRR